MSWVRTPSPYEKIMNGKESEQTVSGGSSSSTPNTPVITKKGEGKDAASGYIPSGSASSSSAPNTPVTHKKRKKRTQKSLTGSSSALSSLKQPSSHEQSNFEAPPSDGSCDNSYQIPMPATTGSGGCLVVKSDQSNSDDADYSRLEHSHPVTGSLTSNQDLLAQIERLQRELAASGVRNHELATKNDELATKAEESSSEKQQLAKKNKKLAAEKQLAVEREQLANKVAAENEQLANKVAAENEQLANRFAAENEQLASNFAAEREQLIATNRKLTDENDQVASKNEELTQQLVADKTQFAANFEHLTTQNNRLTTEVRRLSLKVAENPQFYRNSLELGYRRVAVRRTQSLNVSTFYRPCSASSRPRRIQPPTPLVQPAVPVVQSLPTIPAGNRRHQRRASSGGLPQICF